MKPIGAEGINAQTLGTSGFGIKTFKPCKAFKGLRSGDLNPYRVRYFNLIGYL